MKSVYLINFPTMSLLLMLLPLGCDYDEEAADDDEMVDSSSVLTSTIPSSGGILLSAADWQPSLVTLQSGMQGD